MKTAVSIPDDLLAAGEMLASKLGISRDALYTYALTSFMKFYSQNPDLLDPHFEVAEINGTIHDQVREDVKRRRRAEMIARLNAIYDEEDSSLDPVLAALPARAINAADW